jgi:hypothetical protein
MDQSIGIDDEAKMVEIARKVACFVWSPCYSQIDVLGRLLVLAVAVARQLVIFATVHATEE